MDEQHNTQPDRVTARQKMNRLLGLSSYGMGFVLLAILGFCIYDDPAALRKGISSLVLFAVGALVCFAIGYTTGRKR